MEKQKINFITVIPKNDKFVKYMVDSGHEVYTASYEDIEILLNQYAPTISYQTSEYLNRFKSFIVDIKEQEILELSKLSKEEKASEITQKQLDDQAEKLKRNPSLTLKEIENNLSKKSIIPEWLKNNKYFKKKRT